MEFAPSIFSSPTASLFIGRLGEVAPHVHRAAAIVLSLDGPIRMRTESRHWREASGAWVAPHCAHRLDCAGRPAAVLYLDAVRYGALLHDAELHFGHDRWTEHGVRHLSAALPRLLQGELSLTEAFCAEELLPRVVGATRPRVRLLSRDVQQVIAAHAIQDLDVRAMGRALSLSPSRFSHLFTEQFGVTWTAHRNWLRLMGVSAALCRGAQSITEVALRWGYSSHAHLSASLRQGFGVTPRTLRALGARVNPASGH